MFILPCLVVLRDNSCPCAQGSHLEGLRGSYLVLGVKDDWHCLSLRHTNSLTLVGILSPTLMFYPDIQSLAPHTYALKYCGPVTSVPAALSIRKLWYLSICLRLASPHSLHVLFLFCWFLTVLNPGHDKVQWQERFLLGLQVHHEGKNPWNLAALWV